MARVVDYYDSLECRLSFRPRWWSTHNRAKSEQWQARCAGAVRILLQRFVAQAIVIEIDALRVDVLITKDIDLAVLTERRREVERELDALGGEPVEG